MWSPQHYIDEGLEQGFERQILERAASQIESTIQNPGRPALLTLGHLAKRSEVSYLQLRRLVASSRAEAYHFFHIRKRSGGHRLISVPKPSLMYLQRWIAEYVLNPIPVHHSSFAFKPGSSIVRCVSLHTKARWLMKMDLSGFFGSISEIQIFRVFRQLGYGHLMAFELARLTTHALPYSKRYASEVWQASRRVGSIEEYRSPRIGFLPQGAPTSPMLSNLAMRESDATIEEIAKAFGLRYTRYSDDLTFSTRENFSRAEAETLIRRVIFALALKGLRPNPRKTVVSPPGGRKIVLGLLVDGSQPRLPPEFRSNIRQHLHYMERFGPEVHAQERGFDSVWGLYRHIRGKVDFANMVDPYYAKTLYARLENVSWPSRVVGEEDLF